MDFSSIGLLLVGSTFGLILRIFIQNNFKIKIGFDIRNTSIVNFIASFFLESQQDKRSYFAGYFYSSILLALVIVAIHFISINFEINVGYI